MRIITACLFLLCIATSKLVLAQNQSRIVSIDENDCLRYVTDSEGNHLVDFSYAGYKYGEDSIPTVPVVKTIGPIPGDNTAHIQTALDEMEQLPLNEQGIRGALLLLPGVYRLRDRITVRHSGTVLRGSGNGADTTTNTVLIAEGNTPENRDVIRVGNQAGTDWDEPVAGTRTVLTSEFIPAGARTIEVSDASVYEVGDNVILKHNSTDAWLASIKYGETDSDDPWVPGDLDIYFNRRILKVNTGNNKITLDVPVYDHLDPKLSTIEVYQSRRRGIQTNVGVENLRIDIETAGETDEAHARTGINLYRVEDAWVRGVTVLNFWYAAVDTRTANRATIIDCEGLEPHSVITGARRYNFAVGRWSNSILFENCRANKGRHSFTSNGTSSVSGIVWRNCQSDIDYSSSEGHRRWSQAMLFENITFTNSETSNLINLYNRGNYGTGHGWSSVHSVAWNNTTPFDKGMIIEKPPGRQNYAIGNKSTVGVIGPFRKEKGFIELTRSDPPFPSLYQKQFDQRQAKGLVPDAPARLQAERNENGTVSLNWLDISDSETGYTVEISIDTAKTWQAVATLDLDATSYEHTQENTTGAELQFRVFATGPACPSAYSNPARVEIQSSTRQVAIAGLRVYPNPTTDILTIEATESIKEITVFDALGRIIYQQNSLAPIATDSWQAGMYHVKVSVASGNYEMISVSKI